MPRFDRTGPLGQGSLTGRGLGPCGGGRAYGRRFYNRREESEILEDEAKVLESDLKAVKERLSEIKGKK